MGSSPRSAINLADDLSGHSLNPLFRYQHTCHNASGLKDFAIDSSPTAAHSFAAHPCGRDQPRGSLSCLDVRGNRQNRRRDRKEEGETEEA